MQVNKNELWLGTFPEWAPIPIIETDLNQKITYVNPAGVLEFRDIFEGEHLILRGLAAVMERLKTETIKTTSREINIGDKHYCQYITLIEDHSVMRLFCIDITELKLARSLSMTDELTGVYNRRGFFNLAEQQIRLSNRRQDTFQIIYADLDYLKIINDSFGHDVGDLALVETARILRKVFRKSDVIGRVGGDEFSILAINAKKTDQRTISKRITSYLDQINKKKNHQFQLSISLGFSSFYPQEFVSLKTLMKEADQSLYREKQRKR